MPQFGEVLGSLYSLANFVLQSLCEKNSYLQPKIEDIIKIYGCAQAVIVRLEKDHNMWWLNLFVTHSVVFGGFLGRIGQFVSMYKREVGHLKTANMTRPALAFW